MTGDAPTSLPSPTMIAEDEAHLWFAAPQEVHPSERTRLLDLLSHDERARYHRYLRPDDKALFLTAHVLLRNTIARYLGIDPAVIEFTYDEHGRPEVVGRPLRFNISHAPHLVACLITAEADCGVDVEDTRRVDDLMSVAQATFTSQECAELGALEGPMRRERFFETWTLKEAYVKARGLGLALPLHTFGFDFAGDVRFQSDDAKHRAEEWSFCLIRPTERHIAAVAVRRCELNIVQWSAQI